MNDLGRQAVLRHELGGPGVHTFEPVFAPLDSGVPDRRARRRWRATRSLAVRDESRQVI
ncbi:MAG: hypothetical protein U0610_18725 [bacterium]